MIQKKLTELKNILNYQLKQTIKNVDREFSKAPIDTGLMLKTTELVSITLNTDTLDVELNIKSQEYLKYVENGWGSNAKYGERKVREKSISNPDVQAALEKVYAAIVQEKVVAKMKGNSLRKLTYKV